RMWFAIASAFALVGGAAIALWPAAAPVKWAMAAGLFAILTRSLLKFVQERRRADGEVAGAVRLDVVQSIGGFLLGLTFIAAGARASGAIGGMGAIAAVVLVFSLPGEMSAIGKARPGATRARSYFAYGAPVAAGLVLSAVMATTDRFLLAAFDGETAVGAYHAGSSLAGRAMDAIFIWLAMAGGPAMIAALERGGEAALEKAARRQAETMIAIGLPAMVGLVLVARPLAAVMIGPSLSAEAGMVAAWIAVAGFLAGLTCYYLNLAFTLARRTGLLVVSMSIAAASNVILNLALIPRFGLQGAMWGTTASFAVAAAASLILGRRALHLPLCLATLARAAAAVLAMALAVLALPAPGGILEVAIDVATGAGVYALAAFGLDLLGVRSLALARLATARRAPARSALERLTSVGSR
ncbi:MAG: oligosaccharide flippase family protein, partial [Caulobacteraceae bacterium]